MEECKICVLLPAQLGCIIRLLKKKWGPWFLQQVITIRLGWETEGYSCMLLAGQQRRVNSKVQTVACERKCEARQRDIGSCVRAYVPLACAQCSGACMWQFGGMKRNGVNASLYHSYIRSPACNISTQLPLFLSLQVPCEVKALEGTNGDKNGQASSACRPTTFHRRRSFPR